MNINKLKEMWLAEQEAAHIRGWDFSHIDGRYTQENDLPWNYEEIVRSYLQKDMQLLDIDTGGGEFLLTLGHPYENTFATEGYLPNVLLCEQRLLPLGIKFKKMSEYDNMPFDDDTFDIIINRHGNYDACELYRVLKPNGLFVTQQVGCNNDKELIELLCPDLPKPFPKAAFRRHPAPLCAASGAPARRRTERHSRPCRNPASLPHESGTRSSPPERTRTRMRHPPGRPPDCPPLPETHTAVLNS